MNNYIKYHLVKIQQGGDSEKPKLNVHLFDIDTTHLISEQELTHINLLKIHKSSTLLTLGMSSNPDFANRSIDWVTGTDTLSPTLWEMLQKIHQLKYIRDIGPGAWQLHKMEVRIFNPTFLKELFDRMRTQYIDIYTEKIYTGPTGEASVPDSPKYFNTNRSTIETALQSDFTKSVFYQKVIIPEPDSKVCIIGDIHSAIHSLCEILQKIKSNYFNGETFTLHPNNYIIFLGDIVNGGPYSIELFVIISILKLKNPNNVFIIKGHHEKSGLINEISNEYEMDHIFSFDFLNYLPSCIILDYKGVKYHLSNGLFDTALITSDSYKNDFRSFVNEGNHLQIASVLDSIAQQVEIGLQLNEMTNGAAITTPQFNIVSKDQIIAYLTKYGLKLIISGNQDYINIGCIFKEDTTLPTWKLSKIYPKYNLLMPQVHDDAEYSIEISDDVLSLVTSTAVYSKHSGELNKNCYLELK